MYLSFEDVESEYGLTREEYNALIVQYDEFVGAIISKSQIATSNLIENTGMNPIEYGFYRTMYDCLRWYRGEGPARNPIETAIMLKVLHGNIIIGINDDFLYRRYVQGASDEEIASQLSISLRALAKIKKEEEKALSEIIDKCIKVRAALEGGVSLQVVASFIGEREDVVQELGKVAKIGFNYTKESLELVPTKSANIEASAVGVAEIEGGEESEKSTPIEFIDVGEDVFNKINNQMSGDYERTEEIVSLIKLLAPVYKQDTRRNKSFNKYFYSYYILGDSIEKIASIRRTEVKVRLRTSARELLNNLKLSRCCKKAMTSGEDEIKIISSLFSIGREDVCQFASLYDYVFHGGILPTNIRFISFSEKNSYDRIEEACEKLGLGIAREDSEDDATQSQAESHNPLSVIELQAAADNLKQALAEKNGMYERTDEMIRIVKLMDAIYSEWPRSYKAFRKNIYAYFVNGADCVTIAKENGVSIASVRNGRYGGVCQMNSNIALAVYCKLATVLGEDKVEYIASSLDIKKKDVVQYASLYDYLYSGAKVPKVDNLIGFVGNKKRSNALEQVGDEISKDFRIFVENNAYVSEDETHVVDGLDRPQDEAQKEADTIVPQSSALVGADETHVGDGLWTSRTDEAQEEADTPAPETIAPVVNNENAEVTKGERERRGKRKKTSKKFANADNSQTFTKDEIIEKLAGLFKYDIRMHALKSLIVEGKSTAEVAELLNLPDETLLKGIIDDAEIELLQIMADTKRATRNGDSGFYQSLYNYLLKNGSKPKVNMIEQLKIVDMLDEDLKIYIDFKFYRKWLASGKNINRFCEEDDSGAVGSTIKSTRAKLQEEMALALSCHEKIGAMSNKSIAKSLNIEEEDIARYLDIYQRIFVGSDPMRAMREEKKARLAKVLDRLNDEDRGFVEGYLTRNETPVEISVKSGMTIKATKYKLLSIIKELEALADFKEENGVNVPKRMGRYPVLGKYISTICQLQSIFYEQQSFAIMYSCIIEGRVQKKVAKEIGTSTTKLGRDVQKTAERLQWYVDSAHAIHEAIEQGENVDGELLKQLGISVDAVEYFTKLYEFLNGDAKKADEIKEYFIKDLDAHMKPLRNRIHSSVRSMGKDKEKIQSLISTLKPLLEGDRAFDMLYDSAVCGKKLEELMNDYHISDSNLCKNKNCGLMAIQVLMERAEACYKGRVEEGKSDQTLAELLDLPEETVEMYVKLREFVYSSGDKVDIKDEFRKNVRDIRYSAKRRNKKATQTSTTQKPEASGKKKEALKREEKQSPLVLNYIRMKPILETDEVFGYAYRNIVEGVTQTSIASGLNVSSATIYRNVSKVSTKIDEFVEKATKIHERAENGEALSVEDLVEFNLEEGEAEYYLKLYDALNGGEVRSEVVDYFVQDLQQAFGRNNRGAGADQKKIIKKLKPILAGDIHYDAVYAHLIDGKMLVDISREAGASRSVGWQRKVTFERGLEKLLSQSEACYKGLHDTDSSAEEVAKTLSLPEESVELCAKFYEFIYLDGEPVDIKNEYLKIINPSLVIKENRAKQKAEESKARKEAREKQAQERAEREAQKQAEKDKRAKEREQKKIEAQERQAREREERKAQKLAAKNKVPSLDTQDLVQKLERIFPYSYRIKALRAEIVDGIPFEDSLKVLGFMGEDIGRTKEATGEWVKDFIRSVHTIGKKGTRTRLFEKVKKYNMPERDVKFYEACYHVLFENKEAEIDNTCELARVSKLLKDCESVKISNDYIESIIIEGKSTAEIAKDNGVTAVTVLSRLSSERKKLDFAVSTLQGMLSDVHGGKAVGEIAREKGVDNQTVVGMLNLAHQIFFDESQTEQFVIHEEESVIEAQDAQSKEEAPSTEEPKDLMTQVHESFQKTGSIQETADELGISFEEATYNERLYIHMHEGGIKPIKMDDVPITEVIEKLKQVYPENEKIDLLYRHYCENKSLQQLAKEDGYTYSGMATKKDRSLEDVTKELKRFEAYYTRVAFLGESITEVASKSGRTEREVAFTIQLMRAIYCGKPMPDPNRKGQEFGDVVRHGKTAEALEMSKRGKQKASEIEKKSQVKKTEEKKPQSFEEYRQSCKQKVKKFMLARKTSYDLQMYYNGEDMSIVSKRLGLPLQSAIDDIINLSMNYAREARRKAMVARKTTSAPTDYEIFVAIVPFDKALYEEPLTEFLRLFGCVPKGSYAMLLRAVGKAVNDASPELKDYILKTYRHENGRGEIELDYATLLDGTDPEVKKLYPSIRIEFTHILDKCRNKPEEM